MGSSGIEAKLNKSLEELIAEQSKGSERKGARSVDRSRAGAGGRSAAPKVQQRSGRSAGRARDDGDDAMDTDEAPRRRVDTSVLKAKGGVAKARTSQVLHRGLRSTSSGAYATPARTRPAHVASGGHLGQLIDHKATFAGERAWVAA